MNTPKRGRPPSENPITPTERTRQWRVQKEKMGGKQFSYFFDPETIQDIENIRNHHQFKSDTDTVVYSVKRESDRIPNEQNIFEIYKKWKNKIGLNHHDIKRFSAMGDCALSNNRLREINRLTNKAAPIKTEEFLTLLSAWIDDLPDREQEELCNS